MTRERRGGSRPNGKFRMRQNSGRPFPTNSTGRAGEAASARATRGAPLCASMLASWWIQRRLGGGNAFFFFRMQNLQGSAGRRSPGREIPHAHRTRSPRLPKYRGRSGRTGDRRGLRIEWKAGEAAAAVRMRRMRWAGGGRMPMRMRGTRDARYLQTLLQIHSYAAYLTQIFSTAAIFLRRICLCRYCVGHNATAAIFYRRYCYCSYTHITYSQRPSHSPHPLLTQS